MLSLCDEVWIQISSYFDDLKSIILWKIALSRKASQFSFERHDFWLTIVEQFYRSRKLDITNFQSKYKSLNLTNAEDMSNYLKSLFSTKKCSRSGCFRTYVEFNNNFGDCKFHPGKKNSAGYLTCCREKSFQAQGCKSSFHDGLFFNVLYCQRVKTCDTGVLPEIKVARALQKPLRGIENLHLPAIKS